MSLIQDADKKLIVVSPFIAIEKWYKMKNWIENAVEKNVKITFYVRENADHDLSFLRQLNIRIVPIKNLHAKAYINDHYGIVTSQNMTQASDVNSIDIGYKTESKKELDELLLFVSKYLDTKAKIADKKIVISIELESLNLLDLLTKRLSEKYPDSKFKETKEYIFSGNLIPEFDVMISEKYVVKAYKANEESKRFFEHFKNSAFIKTSNLEVDVNEEHKKFFYVTFTPKTIIESSDLASLFIELTTQLEAEFK